MATRPSEPEHDRPLAPSLARRLFGALLGGLERSPCQVLPLAHRTLGRSASNRRLTLSAAWAAAMTVPLMVTAVELPAYEPKDQRDDANESQQQDEWAKYGSGMPPPSSAPHMAIAPHRARAGRRLWSLLGQR